MSDIEEEKGGLKVNDPARFGQRGEGYVVAQLVLFALVFLAPFILNEPEWPCRWTATWVGGGLILAGVIISLAGVLSLGRNLTAVPYPKDDAVLVERGAFRLVRHPIYSGLIIGSFGWGLLHNSLLTLLMALVLFIFFDIKSRREERWLCQRYAGYADYQSRVRKLIPLIY